MSRSTQWRYVDPTERSGAPSADPEPEPVRQVVRKRRFQYSPPRASTTATATATTPRRSLSAPSQQSAPPQPLAAPEQNNQPGRPRLKGDLRAESARPDVSDPENPPIVIGGAVVQSKRPRRRIKDDEKEKDDEPEIPDNRPPSERGDPEHWKDAHGLRIGRDLKPYDKIVAARRFNLRAEDADAIQLLFRLKRYQTEQNCSTREMALAFLREGMKYIWFKSSFTKFEIGALLFGLQSTYEATMRRQPDETLEEFVARLTPDDDQPVPPEKEKHLKAYQAEYYSGLMKSKNVPDIY